MRLIDADKLTNNNYRICKCGNGVFGLADVTYTIQIAYDVDKVIEQLTKISDIYGNLDIDDAIEIVKKGGIE